MSIIFHSGSDKTNIGGDTYMAGIGDVYEIYMKKNICTWDGTRQTDILLLRHLGRPFSICLWGNSKSNEKHVVYFCGK